MTKMSKGLVLILVLIFAFVFVDVVGRQDHTIQSPWDLSEIQAVLTPASFPTGVFVARAGAADAVVATVAPLQAATAEPSRTATPQQSITPSASPTNSGSPVAPSPSSPVATPSPASTAAVNISKANSKPDDYNDPKAAEGQITAFDTLITPFQNEALKRRAELAKTDPAYSKRVDAALNEGRLNFLLFGYGETHEPPATEKAIIGSQTVVSYDTRTRRVDIISLTHDIRAPEIERELAKRGFKSPPVRIDQAYNTGGFKLMRETIEDATGLAIDFQVTFKDVIMQDLVDSVFDGVMVDIPTAFDVHGFYLDGKKYDQGHFARGLQRLNGRQVIQFIKTVPIAEGAYDKSLEHNVRKALIFDALLAAINKDYQDAGFWIRGGSFVTRQLLTGAISYDFDPVGLFVSNIGPTTANLRQSMSKTKSSTSLLPKIAQSKYVVDPAAGDGGVQWVTANAAVNPVTKKDIDDGVYTSFDMEVPYESDPYADLVIHYWPSVRQLVRTALTSNP